MRILLALVLLLGAGTAANAQILTTAAPLAPPYLVACEASAELNQLTKLYNQGPSPELYAKLRRVIALAARDFTATVKADADLDCKDPSEGWLARQSALDYRKHFVAVMWIGADPFGKSQLIRVVVHSGQRENAWLTDLPGIAPSADDPQLTDLTLANALHATSVSQYASTRDEDPLAADVADLFKTFGTSLIGTVGLLKGAIQKQDLQPEALKVVPKLAVTVKRVRLPFARATVQLKAAIKTPTASERFGEAISELAAGLQFDEGAFSAKARTLAERLKTVVPAAAVKDCELEGPGTPQKFDPNTCLVNVGKAISTAFDGVRKDAGDEELEALRAVDAKFRSFFTERMNTSAELSLTFHNRPVTHFSLGAGTAVIGYGTLTKPRVKLDDESGNLLADPLNRVMTMAFVNWSPRGYDSTSSGIPNTERWRGFFGAVLTPDFGPAAGLNVLLMRGLGVNVGAAVLFGKGALSSEVGAPPPASTDPFRLAVTYAVFAGVTYNYSK
jgi:hypothetical protein